jgi:hypothetical protein
MAFLAQLGRLWKEAEKVAYQRGFRDATRGMRQSLRHLKKKRGPNKKAKRKKRLKSRVVVRSKPPKQPERELRVGSHPHRVFQFIKIAKPPMRTKEIVSTMEAQDILGRTTRTALNRLKEHGFIEKREGRWHPLGA